MKSLNSFHDDLKTAKELVYDQCNFDFKNLKWNTESIEYGACSFELDGKKIQHRASKITPTKNGQFVTIWKRNQDRVTEPFDINDEIDFIIITARSGENLGQFIFTKGILANKGIITQNGKTGYSGLSALGQAREQTSRENPKLATRLFLDHQDGRFNRYWFSQEIIGS